MASGVIRAAMIGLFFRLTYQVLWLIIVLGVTTDSCPFFYMMCISSRWFWPFVRLGVNAYVS